MSAKEIRGLFFGDELFDGDAAEVLELLTLPSGIEIRIFRRAMTNQNQRLEATEGRQTFG